ncbi:hypothetical protein [Tropicibacter oceani]|uniref:DUF1311 domain-containing protein n=1 Tax=Tropicibacter oceani TaxID=3058420 RepID=A0ABY8QNT6_9RHOB|nr:hypothetical protein [Tropicibacter oceani]WGW05708.1 hypothetical protein QF118_09235 [Tropicibacter oceani]
MKPTAIAGVLLLLSTLASPASAEVDLTSVDACIAQARSDGQPPTACIDAAHAACQAEPGDSHMVAALCYAQAREIWGNGIRDRMSAITATAPEKLAAIAGIEVKYDLIANLTQCDRIEELSRLGDATGEEIQRQKARCEATASGLAYLRLVWRSADLPEKEQ